MTDHLKPFYTNGKAKQSQASSPEYQDFTNEFWSEITHDSDNCLGRRCPNFNESFYFLEKRNGIRLIY